VDEIGWLAPGIDSGEILYLEMDGSCCRHRCAIVVGRRTLGAGAGVRGVKRQADEGKAAHEVADHRWNLVPDEIVHNREVATKHKARGEQKHVHDGMLETCGFRKSRTRVPLIPGQQFR
jgi:hypothetical protein